MTMSLVPRPANMRSYRRAHSSPYTRLTVCEDLIDLRENYLGGSYYYS